MASHYILILMVPPGGYNHLWGESVRIRWWKVVSDQNCCHHVLSVKGFVNVWRNDQKQQQCHPHHLWGAIVRWWKVVSNPIGPTSKPTASQFPVTANKRMKGEREFSSEFKATEKRGRSTFVGRIYRKWVKMWKFIQLFSICELFAFVFAWSSMLSNWPSEIMTVVCLPWTPTPISFKVATKKGEWWCAATYQGMGDVLLGREGILSYLFLKLKFAKVRGLILTLIYGWKISKLKAWLAEGLRGV